MRLVVLAAPLALALALAGCMLDAKTPRYEPRAPTQASRLEPIDPYHTDKIPDTPYELRKAEIERDERLAGRGGPTYPPLFKREQEDDGR